MTCDLVFDVMCYVRMCDVLNEFDGVNFVCELCRLCIGLHDEDCDLTVVIRGLCWDCECFMCA